jgi:hypothetical protein
MAWVALKSRWAKGSGNGNKLVDCKFGQGVDKPMDYAFRVRCEDDNLADDGKTVIPEGRVQIRGRCDENGLDQAHDYCQGCYGFTDFQAKTRDDTWRDIFG